ncbi:acetolactate synthase small subunit [Bacillus sp. CGMCC 1.16607]|uniref:acetolactate synthase small subunit n=1 Tax=Bacillus sp. CGMCC 1.16607 TaxID=3351842 RepID=UPI00363020C5
MKRRLVTALVHNQNGVLPRLTGLITKHQFHIESFSVGNTEMDDVSKMTFLVIAPDDHKFKQLIKQLNKQIDVLEISDVTDEDVVARELALIKVLSNGQTRAEINGIVEPFRASIIDVCRESVTVQVTGEYKKIEAIIDLLRPYGIKEIARTGLTAFTRGNMNSVTTIRKYS